MWMQEKSRRYMNTSDVNAYRGNNKNSPGAYAAVKGAVLPILGFSCRSS